LPEALSAAGCKSTKETAMSFVPPDFEVPELLETDRFRVRPLTIHDLVKDYDAVVTSREHSGSSSARRGAGPRKT
jgi:hypothetical protein